MAERAIRPVLDGLFNIVGALDNVVVAQTDAADSDAGVVLRQVDVDIAPPRRLLSSRTLPSSLAQGKRVPVTRQLYSSLRQPIRSKTRLHALHLRCTGLRGIGTS